MELEQLKEKFLNYWKDKKLKPEVGQRLFSKLEELENEFSQTQQPRALFQLQQLICWSPLRVLLEEFSRSSSLALRAAAKGELFDQRGEFLGDSEAAIMARVNFYFVIINPREGLRARKEIINFLTSL